MKRKLTFLLVPMVLFVLAVPEKQSTTRARVEPALEQQEESCMHDAAQDYVACLKAAGDATQRQLCRDFFECRRDACAAERDGTVPKHCKPPVF